MIQPVPKYILLEEIKEQECTASGLVMPDSACQKSAKGKVLAVGEGTKDEKAPCKKGQIIIFRRYGGQEIKEGGKELRLIKFEEVLAIYG